MIKPPLYKFKKNIYKRFLIKLFVLFIILAFVDFIIGGLLKVFYFKEKSGWHYRTTYTLEKTNENLLIFGSSTAVHDYYPEIFERRLNTSYYNVGREGNSIFFNYAVLKAVLKRYTPKIIIYSFDIDEFNKEQESYDRLSSLLPYYKDHPEIRSIVDLKSPFEKYKLLSKIYPYNSSVITIMGGNMDYFNARHQKTDTINNGGYLPLTNVWNEPMKVRDASVTYEADSNKIKMFESFIIDCINSKVKLYIICSPAFIKQDSANPFIALGKEIALKYHVTYFDYSKDSAILNSPKLFADILHLNVDGSKVYSNKVIDSMLTEYPKTSD